MNKTIENSILYSSVLLIPIGMYTYLHFKNINDLKKDSETDKEFIEDKDRYTFFNDIHDKCGQDGKDNCLMSYNLSMSAYDKIKKDGLEAYLNHLIQYPKSFQNENGDYVWLYLNNEDEQESIKGNLYFLYTPSSFINEKYVSATMEDLNNSCGLNKCNHLKIMADIKDISDRAYPKGGFTEYEWFDISTKEMIVKRSFCIKIQEVEYKGEKRTLYMGSGHTKGKKTKALDYNEMNIQMVNIIIILCILHFSNIFKNISIKIKLPIIIGCISVLTINMMNSYKEDYTLDGYIKNISQINYTGLVLETIIISSIIFIRLFKIHFEYEAILYNILMISLGFLIFSSLSYSSDDLQQLRIQLLTKRIAFIDGAILLILGFLLAVILKDNKK